MKFKINLWSLGLLVVLIFGVCVYFFGAPSTFPEVFQSATNLLLWWYIVACAIAAVFVVLGILALIGGGTALGALVGNVGGGLIGFVSGGVLSLLLLVPFAISLALSLGGAYLLHNALTFTPTGNPVWDTAALVVGGILLFLLLLMSMVSSKKNKED